MKIVCKINLDANEVLHQFIDNYLSDIQVRITPQSRIYYDKHQACLCIEGEPQMIEKDIQKMLDAIEKQELHEPKKQDLTKLKKILMEQLIQHKVTRCYTCMDLFFQNLLKNRLSLDKLRDWLYHSPSHFKEILKQKISDNRYLICPSCMEKENLSEYIDRVYTSLIDGFSYELYSKGQKIEGIDAFKHLNKVIEEGHIVAVKGVGGYHLLCDALNDRAVQRLRKQIFRKRKPFAVMVPDITAAHQLAYLSKEEESLLSSNLRPIVLSQSKNRVSQYIGLSNKNIGIFLAYLPIHFIIFSLIHRQAIVMTSANFPGNPTIIDDKEICDFMDKLGGFVLQNKRKIRQRADDSVLKMVGKSKMIIRRSRGFPKKLPMRVDNKRSILALGADLKGNYTFIHKGKVFYSNYLGDLTNYHAQEYFEQELKKFIYENKISQEELTIVHDLHPDFFTTRLAKSLNAFKRIPIQHHQAHLASMLMAAEQINQKVIGIIFDGTGYGEDGTIWGGEVFLGSLQYGFKRYGHLKHADLIGGDAASKAPVQALAGFLFHTELDLDKLGRRFRLPKRFFTSLQLLQAKIATIPTSSIGRLFDAVAALLGYREENSFEGEAAIWLEHLAYQAKEHKLYPFPWENHQLNYVPLLEAIVEDVNNGKSLSVIANSFHWTLAKSVLDIVRFIHLKGKENYPVILSGGVFQNSLLFKQIKTLLEQNETELIYHETIPMNDENISIGQAMLVNYRDNL